MIQERLTLLKAEVRSALLEKALIPLVRPVIEFSPVSGTYVCVGTTPFGPFRRQVCFELARVLAILDSVGKRTSSGQAINKRTLYYQLFKYYKGRYLTLSQDLLTVCFNLGCTRLQLGVLSSSKCLVQGPLVAKQDGQEVDYGKNSFAQVFNYGRGQLTRLQCSFVLILQKQSFLQVLLSSQVWHSLNGVVITAKGYPDYSARALVSSLGTAVPIYYLGDLDPFGLDILLQYCFGSPATFLEQFCNCAIHLLAIDQLIADHPQLFPGIEQEIMPMNKEDRARQQQLAAFPGWQYECSDPIQAKLKSWQAKAQAQAQEEGGKLELEGIWKRSRLEPGQLLVMLLQEEYFY